MKRYLALFLLLIASPAYADISKTLNFAEEDGSPSVYPYKVKVTNGSLTDNGDGTASLSSSGGAPGGSNQQVQFNDSSSFGGDVSFLWSKVSNTLSISRDNGQAGAAIAISSDTGSTVAYLSHDGSALFTTATVNTEVYDATGWNGNLTVPTKDAVRDKIEAIANPNVWQSTAGVTNLITAADKVTVGSSTSLAKLAVDGISNETQFMARGFSTQTTPIFNVRSSDNSDIFRISTDGTITSGGAGTESLTLGSGAQASYVVTFNVSGTDHTLTAGSNVLTESGNIAVADEVYGGTWDGSANVPTKNAVYDKIQTLSAGHKVFMNFPILSAKLSADGNCRVDGGTQSFTMWRVLFDDGTNNNGKNIALWQGRMDDNWSGNSLTAKIDSFMLSSDSTSTANGAITYGVSIWAITSADAASMFTESYDTENSKTQQVSTVMSRDQTVSIPLTTIDSLAAGDWFMVKLRRNGSDTITGDSCVVSFAITE